MYFVNKTQEISLRKQLILERLKRGYAVKGFPFFGFNVGDILSIAFANKGRIYVFEGICIALRRKSFLSPNTSVVLRNVISSIGIEFIISYFCNRAYNLRIKDFQRKKFTYKRAKLFYIRHKLNVSSLVK